MKDLNKNDRLELPQNFICGLKGLARFLGVCHNTALRIKKENRVSYFQIGRKIYFDPDQVLKEMSRSNENIKSK
ncbi:MAG: hypothetical protein CVU12_01370 [Bacteroidetes bacterium HGW-Bacteroidetes-7]|jgi:hypothetical protein|nr:MAG: hypothetical protein CVU12_01370 [Bacteroidetes bacterium HGW-Bacteroidetes-7]